MSEPSVQHTVAEARRWDCSLRASRSRSAAAGWRWRDRERLPTILKVAAEKTAGAERATLIVLFTDLVSSTKLRSRVGEEAADELRRTHDRLLSEAVATHHGRVIKGLGDGIMATFAAGSDAVTAAVTIQQVIDRHNRSTKTAVPSRVRVGVSAGDVTMEDDDVHGTPVIEAARLCARAEGGQILASEVVRLLAGSAGGHEFTPVGALELKGLPAPVSACQVAWEPLPAALLPLPAVLVGSGRIFVGR